MNILSSDYFKELYRLKTYHEVIDEIYNQVDHVEPWMTGNCRGPSTAFCRILLSSPLLEFVFLIALFLMGPRWKGNGSEAKALADPMSKIIHRLQSSMTQSNAHGLLTGCNVLLLADEEQSDLLNRSCFGRPIITTEKDKQWFQFTMEEAFYLMNSLKCLRIVGENDSHLSDEEIWLHMMSMKSVFPYFYKAYHHLRMKNWVVRTGFQYGVDFVAYRHHPSLVHSEYAVVVLSEGDGDLNGRLRVWSDFYCTIRLCGSVAKTLLALYVNKHGHDLISPMFSDNYSVKERTITRWSPEKRREDHIVGENGTK